MKLTKKYLKKIIQEELDQLLREGSIPISAHGANWPPFPTSDSVNPADVIRDDISWQAASGDTSTPYSSAFRDALLTVLDKEGKFKPLAQTTPEVFVSDDEEGDDRTVDAIQKVRAAIPAELLKQFIKGK